MAHLRNIIDIRASLTQDAAEKLVHALVTSRIDCGNALLAGLPAVQLEKIQRVQNTAARVICGARKHEPITPVLKRLHWLPIKFRIQYKILLLTFKALHGLAPDYIIELLTVYQPQRTLRSNRNRTLVVPRTKQRSYGDRAFSAVAPKLWNALPVDLSAIDTLDSFKSSLKTFLFRQAFG